MQWIQAHQATLLLVWPVATALFSLLYTQLDHLPRVHAFFSVLASLGIDLPKLWNAAGRLFTGQPPPAPPSTPTRVDPTLKTPTIAFQPDVPPPPKTAARAMLWGRRVAVCFVLGTATLLTGCAALSQWWQQFEQDPMAQVTAFVQYVQGFVSTAQAIWAIVGPLLGANSAAATTDFNNAIVTVTNALTALEDGVHAAVIAQTPNPDFSALVSAVQDAVAKVVAIIQQWQPQSVRSSATSSTLAHQAQAIASWRLK